VRTWANIPLPWTVRARALSAPSFVSACANKVWLWPISFTAAARDSHSGDASILRRLHGMCEIVHGAISVETKSTDQDAPAVRPDAF
jgi:hypothetical protein